MKCLVTGSEGFIGKNLVALLEQEGHEIVGYDAKLYGTDYDDCAEFEHSFERFDAVFHLACVNQMAAVDDPFRNLAVNAFRTKIMANFAARVGAKFIYTSTASVYGNAEQIPTPVDAKLQPLTDYAVAKLAGEFFVQNSGADWTILRLSNVYGPHQTLDNPYCGVVGRFIQSALEGKPLQIIGDGRQTRDYTFVGDVVRYLHSIATRDLRPNRIENASHGKETSVIELAGVVAEAVGGKHEIEFIGQRPIDGVKRRCLSSRLLCVTGLRPYSRSISGGIEQTVEWWRNERT